MFKEMFELQNTLNDNTNGTQWVHGETNKGKIINWERAMYLEIGEGVDSLPWKHWKAITQQPDFSNLRVELIDVWHFLMSSIIETQYLLDINYNVNLYYGVEKGMNNINYELIEKLFHVEKTTTPVSEKEWDLNDHRSINEVCKELEKFKLEVLILNDKKLYSEKTDEVSLEIVYLLEKLIIQFADLLNKFSLPLNQLYKIYIGKNCLNELRQNNGYKEGTYIKVWNGSEDNVHMLEIVENTDINELTFDFLYEKLDTIYKSL